MSCVEGILYNKGFITDLEDSHQFVAMRKVMNILCDTPMYKRKMGILPFAESIIKYSDDDRTGAKTAKVFRFYY